VTKIFGAGIVVTRPLDFPARLNEFESDLKRLVDDLYSAVCDIVPDQYIELGDDDDEECIVVNVHERLTEAFDDLNWPLRRALGELRKALGS
jgi:hypothetical protein